MRDAPARECMRARMHLHALVHAFAGARVTVDVDLGAAVVEDGRVHVPLARAARAADTTRHAEVSTAAEKGRRAKKGAADTTHACARECMRAHLPRSEWRGDASWPEAVMQISGDGCQPEGSAATYTQRRF